MGHASAAPDASAAAAHLRTSAASRARRGILESLAAAVERNEDREELCDGVSTASLLASLAASPPVLAEALRSLNEEGFIYSTVDSAHYAICYESGAHLEE